MFETPATARPRIALVTCAGVPDLSDDDQRLLRALLARGAAPCPVIWDDPAIVWSRFDVVVLRSTWDYHLRPEVFMAWLSAREAEGATLLNRPSLVRWNVHKAYLRDLAAAGVPTIPTVWLSPSDTRPLDILLTDAGWSDAVVKPAISATAFGTFRVHAGEPRGPEAFARERRRADFLVQPFLTEIAEGELSLVFLGGAFSHAVLKRPAAGDFRVQAQFGGGDSPFAPPREVIAAAAAALRAAPGVADYARVDGVMLAGRFTLMELELIEPALFLAGEPSAAERLADHILSRTRRTDTTLSAHPA